MRNQKGLLPSIDEVMDNCKDADERKIARIAIICCFIFSFLVAYVLASNQVNNNKCVSNKCERKIEKIN